MVCSLTITHPDYIPYKKEIPGSNTKRLLMAPVLEMRGSVDYPFSAMTAKSTLMHSGSTCLGPTSLKNIGTHY